MPFATPTSFPVVVTLGGPSVTPTGCSPSSEEHWYSLRRCYKCKEFYTEAENQDSTLKCRYHTGKFVTDTGLGWTCCINRPFNSVEDYRKRECPGCKVNGMLVLFVFGVVLMYWYLEQHVEDHFFTTNMKQFPFDPNANRDEQLRQVISTEKEVRIFLTSLILMSKNMVIQVYYI